MNHNKCKHGFSGSRVYYERFFKCLQDIYKIIKNIRNKQLNDIIIGEEVVKHLIAFSFEIYYLVHYFSNNIFLVVNI